MSRDRWAGIHGLGRISKEPIGRAVGGGNAAANARRDRASQAMREAAKTFKAEEEARKNLERDD